MIIVVLATEHPERDAWVDEQAIAEADSGGRTLGPYQGVHPLPSGAQVHVFGPPDQAREAIGAWAEYVEAVAE